MVKCEAKWVNCPTKILGIYFSYDGKANNELNFNLKLQRLQSNRPTSGAQGTLRYLQL